MNVIQTDKLTRLALNELLLRSEISFNHEDQNFRSDGRKTRAVRAGEGAPNRCHLTKSLFAYSTIPLRPAHSSLRRVYTHWPRPSGMTRAPNDNKECVFGLKSLVHAVTAVLVVNLRPGDVREVVIGQGAWQDKNIYRRGC